MYSSSKKAEQAIEKQKPSSQTYNSFSNSTLLASEKNDLLRIIVEAQVIHYIAFTLSIYGCGIRWELGDIVTYWKMWYSTNMYMFSNVIGEKGKTSISHSPFPDDSGRREQCLPFTCCVLCELQHPASVSDTRSVQIQNFLILSPWDVRKNCSR